MSMTRSKSFERLNDMTDRNTKGSGVDKNESNEHRP